MATEGRIDVAREGRVAVVTIDRPPVNALAVAMIGSLGETLRGVAADKAVRAVVLTGAGDRAFCAGGDIDEFASMDSAALLAAVRAGQRLVWDLEHLEAPTIAAVNGACLGAGNGLAMGCDLRIASESAVFGHPEVSLGLSLAFAGSVRLARLVGVARAKELIFTARRIPAREALGIGLVNEVVAPGKARDRAMAVANEIGAQSPVAVRAAKKALTEGLEKHYPNSVVAEARYFAQLLEAGELREGLLAYQEKRSPKWRS
ncbi:MAG TPA: enoyl-CoA hydratase-related protein [Thermoplasmata archaeon]|nr:enoyl-CoA hydratase-related protein [Thermoplasmata archaeon]